MCLDRRKGEGDVCQGTFHISRGLFPPPSTWSRSIDIRVAQRLRTSPSIFARRRPASESPSPSPHRLTSTRFALSLTLLPKCFIEHAVPEGEAIFPSLEPPPPLPSRLPCAPTPGSRGWLEESTGGGVGGAGNPVRWGAPWDEALLHAGRRLHKEPTVKRSRSRGRSGPPSAAIARSLPDSAAEVGPGLLPARDRLQRAGMRLLRARWRGCGCRRERTCP
ncbi:uncharacterized protein LOC133379534 [Rhineura floridana]|uniref:uncharacterized protein LOC133379534 n=1 Tax=Rhineura floridana TaxID=261503 RepID=UPI002AC7F961|nr:uncharacterized protein LOC133379534 [Rhineura floridana]